MGYKLAYKSGSIWLESQCSEKLKGTFNNPTIEVNNMPVSLQDFKILEIGNRNPPILRDLDEDAIKRICAIEGAYHVNFLMNSMDGCLPFQWYF